MKGVLITSLLAISVSCGAALAQTQQSTDDQSGANCAAGTANCQNGAKMGEQAPGKAGAATDQQAQGNKKLKTGEQAQGKAGATTDQQATGNTKMKTDEQAQGKAGTTTTEQAQGNTKMKTEEQAQGKAGTTTTEQAQGSTKMKTDEQAQGKAGSTTDQQATGSTKMKTEEQAQGKTGTTTTEQTQGNASTQTQDQSSTASINNVTVEQKTEITQVIKETNVQPVSSVDFDISVGVEVPRKKVRLHRLPARIVKIVPAYEGYEYFVLADGRIVIVDPNTYKIVIILT
ncbi:DUF1236 domain-containing protein [Mesorhizobium sp. M0816]|uniref:DUF1236 domain-containing protein n=1 Tax=Mesorhizobium sp. M0816 TaxID=2957006 RepID=UPI0033380A39